MDAHRECMERRRKVDYRGEVVVLAETWCGDTRVVEGEAPEEIPVGKAMLDRYCRECIRERLNELAKNEG